MAARKIGKRVVSKLLNYRSCTCNLMAKSDDTQRMEKIGMV